ncbi:AMP-binding protein [Psychromarinibacter sp. C21-152]|uniref:AMP-binding protein n=1 Tax=Psychromarinibacter sediminicola TaxID=3033385 RepID=A0AAE3T8Q1_9RHOB|nr:AMP-binding protein [Psychromarinibacter sediminicola]MDF0600953.1 AMP-binding protein [Psychromarinibacter sediminicola]
MTVSDQLTRAARSFGNRTAFICGDQSRTFSQVDDRSNRLANALKSRDCKPRDRVAMLVGNQIEFCEIEFAIAKAEFIRVAINPQLKRRDVQYILDDAGASVLIYDSGMDAMVDELIADGDAPTGLIRIGAGQGAAAGAEDYEAVIASADATPVEGRFDPEKIYCLFYTSGSTGRPKGVMISHRAVSAVVQNLMMEMGPWENGQKILLTQPMCHSSSFFALTYYLNGGCSVIMPKFDAEASVRLIAEHGIQTLKLVPTMLQRIIKTPGIEEIPTPSLKTIMYGASPMPIEDLKRAMALYPVDYVQIYGQSEAAITLTILKADDHDLESDFPERLTSVGRPWMSLEMRIADEDDNEVPIGEPGEIVVRAPHVMSGYWNRHDLTLDTLRNGWLHTNDLGRMDEHGYVYLLGRIDDMIISGGMNIAPRDVEEALCEHPGVSEASVIGRPDEEWGQVVVACVVKADAGLTAEDLVAFAKGSIGFKAPKHVYFLDEFPKNANGKIDKKALKEVCELQDSQ